MLAVVGTSLSVHEGCVDTSEQMTVEVASNESFWEPLEAG
jgi:hypothetical protein